MSFSDDVRKYAKKTGVNLDKVSRRVTLELFGQAIMNTDVDTGRLRGNWQTSTGAPKMTTTERKDKSETRTSSPAFGEAMENVKAFSVNYMTNNLPYAVVEEERKAMVAKSISRIERSLKEAVRDVQ